LSTPQHVVGRHTALFRKIKTVKISSSSSSSSGSGSGSEVTLSTENDDPQPSHATLMKQVEELIKRYTSKPPKFPKKRAAPRSAKQSALREQNRRILENIRRRRAERALAALPKHPADIKRLHSFSVEKVLRETPPPPITGSNNTAVAAATDSRNGTRFFRNFQALVTMGDQKGGDGGSEAKKTTTTTTTTVIDVSSSPRDARHAGELFKASEIVLLKRYEDLKTTFDALDEVEQVIELNITALAHIGRVEIEFRVDENSHACFLCKLRMPNAHSAAAATGKCPSLVQLFATPPRGIKGDSNTAGAHNNMQVDVMTCDSCCILCDKHPLCVSCLADSRCLVRFADTLKKTYTSYHNAFKIIDEQYQVRTSLFL